MDGKVQIMAPIYFSVICATNNEEILNSYLLPSLENQDFKNYELILLDAKKLGMHSAAEVLNYGASIAKGEYFIFVHQDIKILFKNGLSNLKNYCDNNNFGILGVAGIFAVGSKFACESSVIQGKKKAQAGDRLNAPREALSLDECFFVIKASSFKQFYIYGKTWHLYCVDYCLSCLENGERVIIYPLDVYHLSPGYSMSPDYLTTLVEVGNRHKNMKVIPSTVACVRNDRFIKARFKCKLFNSKLDMIFGITKFKTFVKKHILKKRKAP